MQSLNSKNFDYLDVIIRDMDEPYRLTAVKGNALIKFLTESKDAAKHVKLNGMDESFIVVRTTDIQKVLPVLRNDGKEKYV